MLTTKRHTEHGRGVALAIPAPLESGLTGAKVAATYQTSTILIQDYTDDMSQTYL